MLIMEKLDSGDGADWVRTTLKRAGVDVTKGWRWDPSRRNASGEARAVIKVVLLIFSFARSARGRMYTKLK